MAKEVMNYPSAPLRRIHFHLQVEEFSLINYVSKRLLRKLERGNTCLEAFAKNLEAFAWKILLANLCFGAFA